MLYRLSKWKERTGRHIVHLSIKNYRELLMELYARDYHFNSTDADASVLDIGFIKVGRIRFTYAE